MIFNRLHLIDLNEPSEPILENCLTFSSAEPFFIGANDRGWDGTLYYSTDKKTWSEWERAGNPNSLIYSAEHCGEQRIYMRGSGNSVITGVKSSYKLWLIGNEISCNGNIENLLDYETVAKGEHPTMGDYCYSYLFADCTSLVSAPELPATTLSAGCYYDMFNGCKNLTTAPELPATTLSEECYGRMFSGCYSLANAPKLPATTLTRSCYANMFSACTSLVSAPELPATTLAGSCYADMFNSCKSLVSAPELPATTLATDCYYMMFSACTNLATVPELPATTLTTRCYYKMFNGCAGIKLSATQVGEYQTEYRIPSSGAGETGDRSVLDMFLNTGGTFTGTPEINKTYYTSNEMVGGTLVRPNLVSLAKINIVAGGGYTYDNFKWRIAKTGGTDGLIFVTDELTVGETYTFSYKFQKVSGTLSAIGGHCEAFTQVKYTVDGVEPATTYIDATPLSNDIEVHEVVFTGIYKGTASNKNLYVQANRKMTAAVTFDIWDVKAEQGDTATPWLPAEGDA